MFVVYVIESSTKLSVPLQLLLRSFRGTNVLFGLQVAPIRRPGGP